MPAIFRFAAAAAAAAVPPPVMAYHPTYDEELES
jgi:hypothetical protein